MNRSNPSPEEAYRNLIDAGVAFTQAANSLEEAQQIRDAAIVVSSEQGMSRRKVAAAAGVTVGRVQQVLSALDNRARFELADRILVTAVNRLPEQERNRWAEEIRADLESLGPRPMARLAFAVSVLRGSGQLKKELSTTLHGTDGLSERKKVR